MLDLPPDLATFRYKSQTIAFSYGRGRVTKSSRYSRTLVRGGGGGGSISTTVNGYVYENISSIFIDLPYVVSLSIGRL